MDWIDIGGFPYDALEVHEARPLADIIADDYQVGTQQLPAFWAARVVPLEPVPTLSSGHLCKVWLVQVSEQLYLRRSREPLDSTTDAAVSCIRRASSSHDGRELA